MAWPANRPARSRAGPGAAALLGALLGALAGSAEGAPADSARAAAPLLPDSAHARPAAPAAPRRSADWETLDTGLPEETRFRPIYRVRYNRVDGPAPTLGASFRAAGGPAPRIYAHATYAVSRDRPLFEAGAEQPVGEAARVRIGGAIGRRTASEDAWIVGEAENTVFALLARTDYRDYYEAEGVRGHVAWEPGRDVGILAAARAESHAPLRTRTRISAFGKDDRFRPNPPIERGRDRAYHLTLRVGPPDLAVLNGSVAEITWERSGEPLESDFDYGRLHGSARVRSRLTPDQEVRARLLAGSTRRGALPAQKIWNLGGIGTLRGHDYKTFQGDRFFLGNVEYYRLARRNLYALAFLDWGAAWFGSGNWGRQKPAFDGGVGLRLGEGPVLVTLARNLRDPGSPLRVGVRLGGAF